MGARRGNVWLVSLCGVLLVASCSAPSSAVRDFAEVVGTQGATSYGAREIACAGAAFAPYATDRPETTVGYFACWRWEGSVEDAGSLAEVLGDELIGNDLDFFECTDPDVEFFRCIAYDKTGGLGPVVYLIRSGTGDEFDIGFGSLNVAVSQMELIISDG